MSERPDFILVLDIVESIEKIINYSQGLSYEDFSKNSMVREAIERNIEIIGEACNKISDNYKKVHNHIEWNKPIAMRNRLIHGYFAIDVPMLWSTIQNIIPIFYQQIIHLLGDNNRT